MSTMLLVRRYLADYARNPVNLLLLAVVPVVFVVFVAGSMSEWAKVLGGTGASVESVSAGWAAAFLAGIAMYFQVATTRDTDRRVVRAGLSAPALVLARLLASFCLAGFASAAALVALAASNGIQDPVRVIVGTLMFAVVYVAIGGVVGVFAQNPVNGTVIVLFVWILDVFFGPAMGAADRLATRGLPTHFVTLWMVNLPSGHSGRREDLAWAVVWSVTAILAAWAILATRTRGAVARVQWRTRATGQFGPAFRAAWRVARRNPAQWVLFVVVPVVFILTAEAVTPDQPIEVTIDENARSVVGTFPMPDVHSATMAPIAVASLAALVGLFLLLDSRDGDQRVSIAGMKPNVVLAARVSVLALTALAATAVSLATTALVFHPTNWPVYAAANILLALTYGSVGALLAPIFGRVGGVFLAFLLPFLDLGIAQSPMLHPRPTTFSELLPGYGGSRVLLDGALTTGFDEMRPLLIGFVWLLVLGGAVAWNYRRAIERRATISSGAQARH